MLPELPTHQSSSVAARRSRVPSAASAGHSGATSVHSKRTYQLPPVSFASSTSTCTNRTKLAPYAPHPFQSGNLLIQSEFLELINTPDECQSAPTSLPLRSGIPLKTLAEPTALLTSATEGTQIHPQDGRRFSSSSPHRRATSLPPSESMDIVQLYLTRYDKSRRIFRPSSSQSLVHISMHGYIDKVNLSPLRSCTQLFSISVR